MKINIIKISSVLALIIGLMSANVGFRVLTGAFVPDYTFHKSLVIYNLAAGIVSIICGIFIWFKNEKSFLLSAVIFSAHLIVLILISAVYFDIMAKESIFAMIFRTLVWLFISVIVKKNLNK
ncbi:MAG: hypothetical protein OEZ13_04320 [Spirochaetia bacterium]|nr:hypothetical protein [Spirochaetia bacterium]